MTTDDLVTIQGTIRFTGSIPHPFIVNVSKDPEHCGEQVVIQPLKVQGSEGVLEGAVVSLEGVKDMEYREIITERPVVNAQCAFSPRVLAAQNGQEVEVRNLDPILHNTHIKLGRRTFLNVAQVPHGPPIVKALRQPGHYAIRCDKHTFMEGSLVVFDHPYFSVTDSSGVFHIDHVPPGTYQIHVWHEVLGDLLQPLVIPAEGEVLIDIDYP